MDTFQEKKLEELLIKAANEPAHRPEFYSALLKSTIYVIGDTGKNSTAAGQQNLEAGSQINIQSWETQDGKPVIPFFSSLETLQKSIDNELSYLALPANSFFEMTLGSTLFLNPKSDYGKEFTSNEVEQLLKNGLSQAATQRVVEEETKVLLGQPENYPTQMIDSLTQLLAKHSNVKKAYLALMHDTSIDENPHLIVGIEAEGDIEKVISDFLDSKLLDDEEFALQWVQQRSRLRGKSRRILDAELEEKGVSDRIRQIALEEITDCAEEANARAIAEKRASLIRQQPSGRSEYEKALKRIVAALARRGFSASLSYRLAKEALDAVLAELPTQEATG